LEPVIRNFRNVYSPEGPAARLIWLEDNPPTCTMTYSEIYPDKTSAHHIHPWEHEVYIIKGAGTLVCDGKEYPVKAGDAIFIPGSVDHYTLNNGGQGVIRRIEVNPLIAARSDGARNQGGQGTGQPPVIRNLSEIDQSDGPARPIITAKDGAPNYIMAFRSLDPGSTAPNHAHPGEHQAYILEGSCTLSVDGKDYTVSEGDAVLVPPHSQHEWRSNSQYITKWLVFNPVR
jgi:quercetin dioxygenase-like cupin family protein